MSPAAAMAPVIEACDHSGTTFVVGVCVSCRASLGACIERWACARQVVCKVPAAASVTMSAVIEATCARGMSLRERSDGCRRRCGVRSVR